jgi:predicted nucleic acid-binding protein
VLVIDANILIRAVLGKRVRPVFEAYSHVVEFLIPEAALDEVKHHLPRLLRKLGEDPPSKMALLKECIDHLEVIESSEYAVFEAQAMERVGRRDRKDWPVVAAALSCDCAIWTEDTDFFGIGIATWTTDRIEILLRTFGGEDATISS